MKWFKHDTDCDRSEGLSILLEVLGWSGYGRWFRLLEIVASKMDETDRCSARYSEKQWCLFLGLKKKKLKTFLELTENKMKTKVVCCENIIEIFIPNLLKKRDNYTKDLQATGKKLAPRCRSRLDVEEDKEKIPPIVPQGDHAKKQNENHIPFQEIVSDLNKKSGKSFLSSSKETRKLIQARWNQGFRENDFYQVHSNMISKWKIDPKMIDYIRPVTLYGSKFESYLQARPNPLVEEFGEKTARSLTNLKSWMEESEDEEQKEIQ